MEFGPELIVPLHFWCFPQVHFEPVGHSLRHNAKTDAGADVHEKYRDALKRGAGGHEVDESGLPSYIIPGSPEENHWRLAHPSGNRSKRRSSTTGSTVAHLAAQGGDIKSLEQAIAKKKDLVHAKDENGWTVSSLLLFSFFAMRFDFSVMSVLHEYHFSVSYSSSPALFLYSHFMKASVGGI